MSQYLPGLPGDDAEVSDFSPPPRKRPYHQRRVFRLWGIVIPIGRWKSIRP